MYFSFARLVEEERHMPENPGITDRKELREIARDIRLDILEMTSKAG